MLLQFGYLLSVYAFLRIGRSGLECVSYHSTFMGNLSAIHWVNQFVVHDDPQRGVNKSDKPIYI